MHCGPFANIAHGNNSLVADLVALKLGDYVVTESPASARTWAWRSSSTSSAAVGDLRPSAIVLVTTVRALKHHGGDPDGGVEAIERGAANMQRHLGIVTEFGLKAVVAINRFPGDTDEEVEAVARSRSRAARMAAELNEAFERGGEGACCARRGGRRRGEQAPPTSPVYPLDAPIEEKIEAVCKRVYGADGVVFLPAAQEKIERFTEDGFDKLPICMAKTHLSLSHDPSLLNAPTGFTVTVRDIRAYTGAGWLVPLLGDMQTMPGLGETPAAFDVDIDENGRTVGLF